MATKTVSSHQIAKLRATNKELLDALSGLLSVINREDDNGGGGWFICEEAQEDVDKARAVANKYNKK